jgi:DnaK suppressor protein
MECVHEGGRGAADGTLVRKARQCMTAGLTPDLLEELRTQLTAMRAQLRGELGVLFTDERTQGREDLAASRYEEVHDIGEDGAVLEELERDSGSVAVIRERLGDVEHALEKFGLGTYGVCETCSQPIPLARLRLVPEARFDVQHQADHEAQSGGTRA